MSTVSISVSYYDERVDVSRSSSIEIYTAQPWADILDTAHEMIDEIAKMKGVFDQLSPRGVSLQ